MIKGKVVLVPFPFDDFSWRIEYISTKFMSRLGKNNILM
jgi:hypothetical protein